MVLVATLKQAGWRHWCRTPLKRLHARETNAALRRRGCVGLFDMTATLLLRGVIVVVSGADFAVYDAGNAKRSVDVLQFDGGVRPSG